MEERYFDSLRAAATKRFPDVHVHEEIAFALCSVSAVNKLNRYRFLIRQLLLMNLISRRLGKGEIVRIIVDEGGEGAMDALEIMILALVPELSHAPVWHIFIQGGKSLIPATNSPGDSLEEALGENMPLYAGA